jgi:hypothetical protein
VRFAPEAARLQLDLAADLSKPGDQILLFGTPGVALEALFAPLDRLVTFLGEDNPVTSRINALNHASGDPLSIRRCGSIMPEREGESIVILDPPWYPDFVRPMLGAAAAACREGGYVLISLAPEGARPSAAEDAIKISRFAARHGLVLVDIAACALTYETPFFEANALAAAGLAAPHDWRRGDLAVFRKVSASSRMAPTSSIRKARWREVEIGPMRLFIRRRLPGVYPTIALDGVKRLASLAWISQTTPL